MDEFFSRYCSIAIIPTRADKASEINVNLIAKYGGVTRSRDLSRCTTVSLYTRTHTHHARMRGLGRRTSVVDARMHIHTHVPHNEIM